MAEAARIAVLITCHNRRERTLRCLRNLFAQEGYESLEVFLVDDASTDGTADAVSKSFPTVRVLYGSGALYWSGGMRLAHRSGASCPHDFVMWLNDDVELWPHAVQTMVSTARRLEESGNGRVIVVGSLQDPKTGTTTYSGVVRRDPLRPMRFSLVEAMDRMQPCETINGNFVLIPRAVERLVGFLDPAFTHAMSDFDYGLRALQHGCQAWVAPGHMGTCSRDTVLGTWRDERLPARTRWRQLTSPKGLPPREWMIFTRRHGGRRWPLLWVSPYARLAVELLVTRLNVRSTARGRPRRP